MKVKCGGISSVSEICINITYVIGSEFTIHSGNNYLNFKFVCGHWRRLLGAARIEIKRKID